MRSERVPRQSPLREEEGESEPRNSENWNRHRDDTSSPVPFCWKTLC